jgi:hypothetical protein
MTRLRTLATFEGFEIVIGSNGCAYFIGPDGWQPIDSPYSGILLAPMGIRRELAKQLSERKEK